LHPEKIGVIIIVGVARPYTRFFIQHKAITEETKKLRFCITKTIICQTRKNEQRKISYFEQRRIREKRSKTTAEQELTALKIN
jgi:hypothetical protein